MARRVHRVYIYSLPRFASIYLSHTHFFFPLNCLILSVNFKCFTSHFTPKYFIIYFPRTRAWLHDYNSLTTFRKCNTDIILYLKFVYIQISPGVPKMSFIAFFPIQDSTKEHTLHLFMSLLVSFNL